MAQEKLRVYELDFGDTNLLDTDPKTLLEWIDTDIADMGEKDELNYTITIRMMTKEEYEFRIMQRPRKDVRTADQMMNGVTLKDIPLIDGAKVATQLPAEKETWETIIDGRQVNFLHRKNLQRTCFRRKILSHERKRK